MWMKAIKDIEGFQFIFYSNEGTHIPHIHVKKGDGEAIIWINTWSNIKGNLGYEETRAKESAEVSK